MIGRAFQALGLLVSAVGLLIGMGIGPVDESGQGDLGTEVFLFGVGLALFMLGLLFAKKSDVPKS